MALSGALPETEMEYDLLMRSLSPATSDWKPLYEAALFESDPSHLRERISSARSAILNRIEDTLKNPLPSEQRAMDDALRTLRRLAEMVTPGHAA